jgi:hypothetical protein
MIIEVALGIALGLFIFANWRGLLTLGILLALFMVLLVVGAIAVWTLYAALPAAGSLPPLVQPGSLASNVLGVGFGILMNVFFAFAVGAVIEQRLRLAHQESFVLGCSFWVLMLVSVFSVPIAIGAYLENRAATGPLLLLLLLSAWVLAVRQCVRRSRRARQQIAV